MPEDGWLEAQQEFLRDLENESVALRQRAEEAERQLHELGESLQGDMIDSVSDEHLGDHPDDVKRGLKEAYGRLLDLDFDNLLVAHGDPVVGGAKEALRSFVEG